MPYEKHTWQTGETITAEKLNNIEDGVENSDKGYDYSLTKTNLFSETINSTYNNGYYVATFSYSQIFDNDELIVVFDDVEYFCNKNVVYGQSIYGGFNESGPTFTDFPFVINSSQSSGNTILTSTGGTHTVIVQVPNETINTTNGFEKAVNSIINNNAFIIDNPSGNRLETTWKTIRNALSNGTVCYVHYGDINSDEGFEIVASVTQKVEGSVYAVGTVRADNSSVYGKYYSCGEPNGYPDTGM